MLSIQQLLVGLERPDEGGTVLEEAALLARTFGARLRLAHVLTDVAPDAWPLSARSPSTWAGGGSSAMSMGVATGAKLGSPAAPGSARHTQALRGGRRSASARGPIASLGAGAPRPYSGRSTVPGGNCVSNASTSVG